MNPVQSLLTTHSLGEMLLLLLLGSCWPYSNYNISRVCLPMKAIKMGMNEGRLKAHSGLLACSLPETPPPALPPPCVPFSLVIMLLLLEATTTTVLYYVTGTPTHMRSYAGLVKYLARTTLECCKGWLRRHPKLYRYRH